jgi:hypothetical protein
VSDVDRIAVLEARVAACEEYIKAWLILEEAKLRRRERAEGQHLRPVPDR